MTWLRTARGAGASEFSSNNNRDRARWLARWPRTSGRRKEFDWDRKLASMKTLMGDSRAYYCVLEVIPGPSANLKAPLIRKRTYSICWRAVISRRCPEPSSFYVVGRHGSVATNPRSQRKLESCREASERESVPLRTNQQQGSGLQYNKKKRPLRRSLKETGGAVGPGSLRVALSSPEALVQHAVLGQGILQGHGRLWHFRGFCLLSLSSSATPYASSNLTTRTRMVTSRHSSEFHWSNPDRCTRVDPGVPTLKPPCFSYSLIHLRFLQCPVTNRMMGITYFYNQGRSIIHAGPRNLRNRIL